MYDALNWYWIVGGDGWHADEEGKLTGDESQVYSSARNEYVPADDETYVEWRGSATDHNPTRIESEDSLQVVLEPYGIMLNRANPTPAQQAAILLRQPVNVTCAAAPQIDGAYPLDQGTQLQITGIASSINAGLGVPGGMDTFNWPDASGQAHQWTGDQFVAFARGAMNYLYQLNQVAGGHGDVLPPDTIVIT